MISRLVILCTSERSDPYFNVIAHSVIHLGLRDFLLVVIGDAVDPKLTEKAGHLADDLSTMVSALGQGEYWRRESDGTEHRERLRDREPFDRMLERLRWGSLSIARSGVPEDKVGELLRREVARGAAFDVTACKNSLVAGASAALVASGGSPIYTFEMRKRPTFGQADLLPMLDNDDYFYRDLRTAPLLASAIKTVNRFRITRRNFIAIAVVLAVLFGLLSLSLSQTALFALLTGFASFASIVSALALFVRD